MEIIRDKIEGNKTVQSDLRLNGMITGSVTVTSGAVFELGGMVVGDLVIE